MTGMGGNVSEEFDPKGDVNPVGIFAGVERHTEESVEERRWDERCHAGGGAQGICTTRTGGGIWDFRHPEKSLGRF